ncbi:hypothetical protein ACFL02_02230 [Planctomycetota bacterium]
MIDIKKWYGRMVTVLIGLGLIVMISACDKTEPAPEPAPEQPTTTVNDKPPAPASTDNPKADVEDLIDQTEQETLQILQQMEAELNKIEAEKNAQAQKLQEIVKPLTEEPVEELVPLEIELPRPMFVGTPPNTKIERVEKPLGKPRPLLEVPVGTLNLSKEKPVTSSDDNPIIGDLEQITDDDNEGIDGNWVELMFGTQWVQIDLEETCEIYAVVFWHFHMQPWVFRDVVVQVSDDPDFVNVTTLFNNDYDNSSGLGAGDDLHYVETSEGKLVEGKGIKARYVRLYSNGNTENDSNQYIEVGVYGKPIK